MKTLSGIFFTAFLCVGSIVGAGFISGRELIGFFGTKGFLPFVIFAGIFLCACLLLLFSLGKEYDGADGLNNALMKNPRPFGAMVLIASFVFLSTMLAGLDAIGESFGMPGFLPVISSISLVCVTLCSRYGLKGIEKINFFLVPVVIVIINALIFTGVRLDFSGSAPNAATGIGKAALYVFLNAFSNLPVLVSTARGKSRRVLIWAAIVTASLICVEAVFILAAVNSGGANAQNAQIPLLYVLGDTASAVYAAAVFAAILSSLSSAYYPLYVVAKEKMQKTGVVILCLSSLVLSRIGLKGLVDYVYPLLGALGAIYIIKCAVFKLKKVLSARRASLKNNNSLKKRKPRDVADVRILRG